MIAKYILDKMLQLEEDDNYRPHDMLELKTCTLALIGLAKHGYCVAVDFDGTLCTDLFPQIGAANKAIVDKVKLLQAYGIKTILWTCREGEYLQAAVKWCDSEGLKFDAVNQNIPERIDKWGNDSRKIGADEYWDDKAVSIV